MKSQLRSQDEEEKPSEGDSQNLKAHENKRADPEPGDKRRIAYTILLAALYHMEQRQGGGRRRGGRRGAFAKRGGCIGLGATISSRNHLIQNKKTKQNSCRRN